MPNEVGSRRLAAILALDIVGYSRMMGQDEDGTLARLKMLRGKTIDPAVLGRSGRVIKSTGDGILADFASARDAISAAIDIQDGLSRENATFDAEQRMEARIGVNVSDVIFDDGDVFGDGVNIAARLESLAPPGGICVSGRAIEELRALRIAFEDRGLLPLKNIALPVRVLCISSAAGDVTDASTTPDARRPPTLAWRRTQLRHAVLIVAALALLALVGIGYTLHRNSAPDAFALVSAKLADVPCSWLRIADSDDTPRGIELQLSGAADAADGVAIALAENVNRNGARISNIDTTAVAPIGAQLCAPLELFRKYRAKGIARIAIANPEQKIEQMPSGRAADFDILLRSPRSAAFRQLFSISPNGLIRTIGSQLAEKSASPPRKMSVSLDQPGWSGLILVSSISPIPIAIVNQAGTRRDLGYISVFDKAADRGSWSIEMSWLNAQPAPSFDGSDKISTETPPERA